MERRLGRAGGAGRGRGGHVGVRGGRGARVECHRGWKQRGEAVRAFYGVVNFILSLNYKLGEIFGEICLPK